MRNGLRKDEMIYHRMLNFLQSFLLLGGMSGLLGFLGWMIAGWEGLLWSMIAGGMMIVLSPRLSPHFIMRFHRARRVSASEAPRLHALLQQLVYKAELSQTPELYIVPNQSVNAFAVGSPRDSAIGVTEGLLQRLNLREVAGVLAHEVAHIRHNDIWVMGLSDSVGRLTRVMSWVGMGLLLINLPMILVSGVGLPWVPVFILMVTPLFSTLLHRALSRTREFDADLGAARLTGDPMGLASALKKINQLQKRWALFLPQMISTESSWLRSHPASEQRIARLQSITQIESSRPTYHAPAMPPANLRTWPSETAWGPLLQVRHPRMPQPFRVIRL